MVSDGGAYSGVTLYTDAACTQAATAQQVIDAFSAGGVRIAIAQTSGSSKMVVTVLSISHPTIATQAAGGGSSPATILLIADPSTLGIVQLELME